MVYVKCTECYNYFSHAHRHKSIYRPPQFDKLENAYDFVLSSYRLLLVMVELDIAAWCNAL